MSRIHLLRAAAEEEESLILEDIPDGKIKVPVIPSQTQIEFPGGIKTVFLVKKWKDKAATDAAIAVANYLRDKYGCSIVVEAHVVESDDLGECSVWKKEGEKAMEVDIVIILGGDGTLLHANSLFQDNVSVPPVLGFALGSLGFLVPYQFEAFEEKIDRLMTSPRLDVCLRSRLCAQVLEPDGSETFTYQPLNEILIDRGTSPFLTLLDFFVNDRLATYIQADGVIISSATGSTAYSLSAGGPMLSPSVPAIVITPVCPHTLSFRPLVLPDSSKLRVNVPESARAAAFVTFDGRELREIPKGGQVVISTSPYPMPTICLVSPMMEWFMSIKHRLNWNVRDLQKGLSQNPDPTPPKPGQTTTGQQQGKNKNPIETEQKQLMEEEEKKEPKDKKIITVEENNTIKQKRMKKVKKSDDPTTPTYDGDHVMKNNNTSLSQSQDSMALEELGIDLKDGSERT